MKKVVILVAIAALLAAPAFAGIRNSKHDLSSSSSAVVRSTNTDELCVFCHTPHAGETGGFAPLWNRSLGSLNFVAADLYNSATLESTTQPTQVVDAVNESDAKLCLSCHDGGSLAGGLLNPPASNGNIPPTFDAGKDAATGNADLLETGEAVTNGLENDHPIGMPYTDGVASADGELYLPTSSSEIGAGKTLPLYTTTNGTDVMWCSSCHDVHNPEKGTPFLNMTNAGSAMCLTCHKK
jgi:predicted CXXCH cytochrome family protein